MNMQMIITATGDAELTTLVGLIHSASQEIQKDPRNAPGFIGALRIALSAGGAGCAADSRAFESLSDALLHSMQHAVDKSERNFEPAKATAKSIVEAWTASQYTAVEVLEVAEDDTGIATTPSKRVAAKPKPKAEAPVDIDVKTAGGVEDPADETPTVNMVIADWTLVSSENIAAALVAAGETVTYTVTRNAAGSVARVFLVGDNLISGGPGAAVIHSLTTQKILDAARNVFPGLDVSAGTRAPKLETMTADQAKIVKEIIGGK